MKITVNQERGFCNSPTAINLRIDFGNTIVADLLSEIWPTREKYERIISKLSRFGNVKVSRDEVSYEISNTHTTRLIMACATVLSTLGPVFEIFQDKVIPDFKKEIHNIHKEVEEERNASTAAPAESAKQ